MRSEEIKMDKKQWTRPVVTEFEIAERTQFGDGRVFDGTDPSFSGGGSPGSPDSGDS
jgi:hypothetical protein